MRISLSILIFVLTFQVVSFAEEASLAQVLEWKYGLVADTEQVDPNDMSESPEMKIKHWRHPNIPQPTKDQLKDDTVEYKSYIADKKTSEEADEQATSAKLMSKLDLTQDEIVTLKRILNKLSLIHI